MTRREYEGFGTTVHWDSERCTDSGRCVADLGSPLVRIIVRGELDSSVRKELDELASAVARTGSSFLLDCAGLSFIDAGGISSLVRAHALGATVVGTSDAVRRTLALVGLVEVLGRPAEATRI